jgi:ankyrin repeat protein
MGAKHTNQGHQGRTELHSSSIDGNEKVVRLLLKNGAGHTIRDHEEYDPLHQVLWNSNEEVAKALLEHGTSITSRDSSGNTPLHIASCCGLENTVKLLLDAGADLNALEENGRTAIHRACFGGHESAVELLIAASADSNIADIEGRLPLHDAAFYGKSGNKKTVRLLLDHGADPFAQQVDGGTVLFCATDQGNLGVVKILLEIGRVNVNTQARLGRTALHVAAIMNFEEIWERLIEYGADASIQDNQGLTPEGIAKRHAGFMDLPRSGEGI